MKKKISMITALSPVIALMIVIGLRNGFDQEFLTYIGIGILIAVPIVLVMLYLVKKGIIKKDK